MVEEGRSAGDPLPPHCELIEVHVSELRRLFHSMDPSPFYDRDLDPGAVEFIVGWAREAPRDARLALLVHVDRPAGPPGEPAVLRDAISEHFARQSKNTLRRMRALLRIGRKSLVIGLAFLTLAIAIGDLLATAMEGMRVAVLLKESVLIGGWVAMWRPLEIFLYDWWPIREEAGLYRRLAEMPVRLAYADRADPDAWRVDWPAVPSQGNPPPMHPSPRRSREAKGE